MQSFRALTLSPAGTCNCSTNSEKPGRDQGKKDADFPGLATFPCYQSHFLFQNNNLVAPRIFAGIKSGIGPEHDRFRVFFRPAGGHAHSEGNPGCSISKGECFLFNGPPDFFSQAVRTFQSGVRQQKHEFFSAPAADEILGPQGLPQQPGQFDQQSVTGIVPVIVVTEFEMIDISQNQGIGLTRALTSAVLRVYSFPDATPIGQSGQVIGQRQN